MKMEVLYCINYPDGYKKISAIKPVGWQWGKGELDTKVFEIVTMDITDIQKTNIENANASCINSAKNGIVVTPSLYKTAVSLSAKGPNSYS
jgi:hypothetical protein